MRRSIVIACLISICLVGCGAEEEVEEEYAAPPLTEISDSYAFEDIGIKAIGTHCGFCDTDTGIEIHPYNDNTKHISVRKILLSDRPYWDTILSSQVDNDTIVKTKKYSMFTTSEGISYGYYEVGEYAYVFKSDGLPSSYMKAVLDRVWIQDS